MGEEYLLGPRTTIPVHDPGQLDVTVPHFIKPRWPQFMEDPSSMPSSMPSSIPKIESGE